MNPQTMSPRPKAPTPAQYALLTEAQRAMAAREAWADMQESRARKARADARRMNRGVLLSRKHPRLVRNRVLLRELEAELKAIREEKLAATWTTRSGTKRIERLVREVDSWDARGWMHDGADERLADAVAEVVSVRAPGRDLRNMPRTLPRSARSAA